MNSMCISARNEFTTSPENLISPKSWSHADHVSDLMKDSSHALEKLINKLFDGCGLLPLREEENVDLNSNDSSYTMRGSTSLPSANAVGKCSNLGLTSGSFKDSSHALEKLINKLFDGCGLLPLPEEENVDLNSNDSSYTMRGSTSLPSANAVGKCSNLGLTSGSFKEAGEKTPHVVIKPFQIPVYEPPKIIVLSSRPLAGPSIFNCCPVGDSTIPTSSNSSAVWILDSGAARHVCYSLASFESFFPTCNLFVALPNGHTISVGGTGSVRLCNELTLQNVLFVPQFHWNLLSISALTQQHPYVVSFHSDHYVIEDPTQGRRIGIGRQAGNLYTLDLSQMFFVSP